MEASPKVTSFQKRKQYGFTLLELVLVIAAMVILAVFSGSRWTATITPNAGAEQLAADIRYTQSLAMTHGQRFLINITAPNSYSITTVTGATAVPSSITGANTVALGSTITYGTLTNLPSNLIAFDGQGIPYINAAATTALATTATIPVTNGGGVTRTISISPTTGQVTIQ